MNSTISVSKVLTKDILEGFLGIHKRYKQEITKDFEDYAVRTYTKRKLFRDRTPAEAITYAREIERWEYPVRPAFSDIVRKVKDFLEVIDNFQPGTINLDIEFAAKILNATAYMQFVIELNKT